MKLVIVRAGGLGGFTTTTRLRAEALPPQDAQALEAKVRSLDRLTSPEPAAAPGSRHPDDLLYEVTVADGEQERTLRFSDENQPDEVRALIEWVDSRPERELEHGA